VTEINLENVIFTYELDLMKEYLDLLRNSIDKHIESRKQLYIDLYKKAENDKISTELSKSEIDDFICITDEINQLFLTSFLVSWYSFIERTLIYICEHKDIKIQIGIFDNEKLDSGIKRVRKFLLLAKGYEINTDHWNTLIIISKIRNHIVHIGSNYNVKEKRVDPPFTKFSIKGIDYYCEIEPEIFRYLEEKKIIYYDGITVRIALTLDYCYSLLDLGKEIINKIYSEIN
jgi:hypothetical protein